MPLIRPAGADDTAGLLALIAAAWGEYPGLVFRLEDVPELRAPAAHCVARGGALWIAEESGRVVGSAAALPHPPGAREIAQIWEIAKMYVAPGWRGRGLAARLLEIAESHAIARGAEHLVLWSDTRFATAHRFYERHHYLRRAPMRVLADSCRSLEFPFARPAAGEIVWDLDTPAAASAARTLAGFAPGSAARLAETVREVAAGRARLRVLYVEGRLAGGAAFAAGAEAPLWSAFDQAFRTPAREARLHIG